MAVTYKIGADASSFKKGVNEAQASLKTLDAALKVNEASFKAGGDAQVYMEQKTKLLSDKMTQQKQLVTQLQQGLKQMREQGISPTSVAYQKLEAKMLNAQTAMLETQNAVDGLDESQQKAAGSAGDLATAVNGIGKKISLDQVIGGIDRITGALQTAAGAAVDLGQKIWDNVMSAAKWADDSATMALMYGIDLDTFLRMQKLVTNGMDTSVDAMLKSRDKLAKNIGNGGDGFLQTMKELGLLTETVGKFGEASKSFVTDDPTEMFWKAGQAIMAMGESFDKEAAAQQLFGKSWKELVPLFKEFNNQADYEKALQNVKVNTEEEVNDLATLNDRVSELQGNIETLTNKGWAALAPSLAGAAEALNGLLGSVLKYLDTPKGKEALQQMSDSVSTLFEDLGKIDPESVVNNFVSVFEKLKNGFEWIVVNKGSIITALETIVAGWAGLKLTGGALQVLRLVNALTTLGGGGSDGGGFISNAVSGIASWGENALSWLTEHVGGALNGVAIGDWFLNGTTVGQGIRNTGDIGGSLKFAWDEFAQNVKNNAASFRDDWQGVINQVFGGSEGGGGSHGFAIPAEPKLSENAAAIVSEQIGIVPVQVQPVFSGAGYGGRTGGGTMSLLSDFGNGLANIFGIHANGLWSVPFDNYPALLHRGERVVPAREVSSRSYNSNLYVEKMIMNNGADAQGLANAMAAANRRRMSGYGS